MPVDRFIRVDRPYEVIKYIQEPYIVRVERPYHVAIETKIPVPKPIVQVEPVIPEPQHIVKEVHHEEASQPIPEEPKNDYLPPPQPSPPQPQNDYLPPQQSEQKSQFIPPPPSSPLPQPLPRPQQPQSEYLPPRH